MSHAARGIYSTASAQRRRRGRRRGRRLDKCKSYSVNTWLKQQIQLHRTQSQTLIFKGPFFNPLFDDSGRGCGITSVRADAIAWELIRVQDDLLVWTSKSILLPCIFSERFTVGENDGEPIAPPKFSLSALWVQSGYLWQACRPCVQTSTY
ncbi:hypothetical protein BKA93DRAFT_749178 [Sparassis latifolia]